MEGDRSAQFLIGVVLLFLNLFFVAAEYALVGSRRSRFEALAKQNHATARLVLSALDNITEYVAGIQVAITICGIGIGALVEPALTAVIKPALSFMPIGVVQALSILIVTYPLVVVGELVPKYVTLRYSERVALLVITPLRLIMLLLRPIVWLVESSGGLVLRLFGIDPNEKASGGTSREELVMMLQGNIGAGAMQQSHADMLTRGLRLDTLDAADIMIHRLDIQWMDVDTPREQVVSRLGRIIHTRIPVCRGDVDEVVGVAYLQDIVRVLDRPDFSLEKVMRPASFVPENLTLDKLVTYMREAKTQILIVRDEYGGTSGLLTLEDVVEEIFGDMEDRLESERPPIEWSNDRRITARADVRYDELLSFLKRDTELEGGTSTLASMVMDKLHRVPKLGDRIDLPIGTLRVENMARRRITRVSIVLPEPSQEG